MENKNKPKESKLTVKNINKTCGLILFVLVFLFTFFITYKEFKPHWVIILSVFGGVILLFAVTWLILVLVVRNENFKSDPNKQKINQILEDKKKEQKYKNPDDDKSNN